MRDLFHSYIWLLNERLVAYKIYKMKVKKKQGISSSFSAGFIIEPRERVKNWEGTGEGTERNGIAWNYG